MGELGTQDWVAFAISALALGWLAWRAWRKRRRPASWCGDCPGCEAAQCEVAPAEAPLVRIAPPPRGR
jgi:hypothetical protein